jgi:hypothetical protein
MEKFGEVSKQVNDTMNNKRKVDKMLAVTGDMKLSQDKLDSLKKMAKNSLE